MDSSEILRIASRSLRGHRLRSALTVIGVVIGIATVIAFASFGASVQTSVVDEFEETSANEIFITPETGDIDVDEEQPGPPQAIFADPIELLSDAGGVFTQSDVDELQSTDGVIDVIPRGAVLAEEFVFENESASGTTIATSEDAFSEDAFTKGEAFDQNADQIVINEAANESFEGNLTTGSTLTVTLGFGNETESHNVTVAGIVEGTQGEIEFGPGLSEDPRFYLPAQEPYYSVTGETVGGAQETAYQLVTVTAEADQLQATQQAVDQYIQEESDAADNTERIVVQSSLDIAEGIESVISDVTRLATGIGILALIVGSFGVANIMLVSVTERTKEIGIMKAIGARNRDVMSLFLTESTMIGIIGSFIGIPLGLGTGLIAASYADVGFAIPTVWIGLAVAMGLLIGIIAGVYPAWRATRIDPIEALRYE